jgi:prepilin-type N-terminal cleavage/methylation domain-containing protein
MLRRAFTLIELLVSLSVLLVVIIATARIFGTTSKVAALGEASADLQATATAVEKIIRGDIERIARDGVLAIQCVAVRNDVNRYQRPDSPTDVGTKAIVATAPLLNPSLGVTDFIRCDQIVFFARGHEASQVYLGGRGKEQKYAVKLFDDKGKTTEIVSEMTSYEFMVRIGHAMQFPTLLEDSDPASPTYMFRPDPDTFGKGPTLSPPVPWMWSPNNSPSTALTSSYFSLNNIAATSPQWLAGQPEARQWVLSRQATLLADDGYVNPPSTPNEINHLTFFHTLVGRMSPNSASGIAQFGPSSLAVTTGKTESTLLIGENDIFPNRAITSSRVDTAATSIAEYRAFIETGSTSANLSKDFNFDSTGRLFWSENEGVDPTKNSLKLGYIRNRIFNSLFGGNVSGRTNGMWGYPRAEKVAPSMNRVDTPLSIPLLAGNCSSIQIDWTWSTGTARFETPEGTPLLAQIPAAPVRGNTAVFDVPLAGLTTVPWPVQPFLNSPIDITKNENQSEAKQILGLSRNIPWFGLPDSMFPIAQRSGVTRLAGPLLGDKSTSLTAPFYATPIRALTPFAASRTLKPSATDIETIAIATPPIDCARIEGITEIKNSLDNGTSTLYSIYTYQAIFGPNGDKPFREVHYPGGTERVLRSDYTPWPTALRFTITLHDPKLALAQGRVFQFVVDLPKADR